MKRLITDKILEWSKNDNALPLFILGARQIGKTYTVLDFANNYFKNKYIYFNFIDNRYDYQRLKNITNPLEIINTIKSLTKKDIDESWLLIFDEIQEMSNIRTSLKLFVEQNYKYKIICLGSYLGNILNDQYSFPVGKIQSLNMYPMNFEEFLIAKGEEELINKIKNRVINNKVMDNVSESSANDLLIEFLLIGGMPKVLDHYLKTNNILQCNLLKNELLESYAKDIVKYIQNKSDKIKCQSIYENIPKFLAKPNKKYKLSNIDNTARYLNYDNAIKSLLTTKIIYKINNLNTFSAPLKMHYNESEFKTYYNDCGFISTIFDLNQKTLLNAKEYGNIKGALFENYVLNELAQKIDISFINYYAFRDKNNNLYEIDFCIEDTEGNLIPIEVKSSDNFETKSLNKLFNEKKNIKNALVFSFKNFIYDNHLKHKIPLYAVGFLPFEGNRIKLIK